MNVVVVNKQDFLKYFPEFTTYSTIDEKLEIGCEYIGLENNEFLYNWKRKRAIYLLTAHSILLSQKIEKGDYSSFNQKASSSIGSVNVSIIPPINKDELQYWLNLTPYGKELLALLKLVAPDFVYYGGSFNRFCQ